MNSVVLGDLAERLQDGPFGSNLKSSHYVTEGVRVVRLQNVGSGFFDDADAAFISESHFSRLGKHTCRPGDVLIATLGDPILRACIQPDTVAVALNKADCVQLRVDTRRADPRYVMRYLNSDLAQARAELLAHGQTRQRVNLSQLREMEVPLPPLDEQRRIAAILDAADSLRVKRRQAIAKLDTLTRSIFIGMFGEPTSNTAHWPLVTIGDVLQSATYGTSRKAGSSGAFPVLRMGNLTADGAIDLSDLKYVDLDEPELPKHLVSPGDVLFNRTNSPDLVGKTAVYRRAEPMAFAGYLVRLRPSEALDSEYLGAFMNLPSTKRRLRAMCKSIIGMANINATEVRSIAMPLPRIDIQRKFAAQRAQVDEHCERAQRQVCQLDALFASLQQRAFRGDL